MSRIRTREEQLDTNRQRQQRFRLSSTPERQREIQSQNSAQRSYQRLLLSPDELVLIRSQDTSQRKQVII